MLNADQVKELINTFGLIATVTRNKVELANDVKAVIINKSFITQFPLKAGDIIFAHNKSHKVLSVTSIADNLYFQGTYSDYV